MRLRRTAQANRDLARVPEAVRRAFWKQAGLLASNLRHPSLRAKKYDEAGDIWQGRVTRDWRFYFQIAGREYVVLSLVPHPK